MVAGNRHDACIFVNLVTDETSLMNTSLLQHLALVLHQQLHPLDGGGGRLGHAGRHAGEHEVLEETQLGLLLVRHLVGSCPGVLQDNL